MKRDHSLSRLWTLLAAVYLLAATTLLALDVPPAPTSWFTDQAGIVDAASAEALDSKLKAFEQRSGAQFIIYVFPALENENLEDFALRCANEWKVGQKKNDNGLILFLFMKERKVRIEIGYGMEEAITDRFASRVIREQIAPHFQKGDYAGGLNAAADALMARPEKQTAAAAAARIAAAAAATRAEEQRQAEKRKQAEIALRSAAFVKGNRVAHYVTIEQLAANPFVYQGEVVAIYGVFEQMNTATRGLFSSHGRSFLISGLPTDRFTQRSVAVLAGRVLGNVEINLPSLGPTLVPHLSFVGSALCQEAKCADYAIDLK